MRDSEPLSQPIDRTAAKTTRTLPKWSAVIFAHNEARRIGRCIDSVLAQTRQSAGKIHVLVNGSTDGTAGIVGRYSEAHPMVQAHELPLADKAAAWNHYVHDIAPFDVDIHFFIDGDVYLAPHALSALASDLDFHPAANAVSAMPVNGRDRAGWSQRMISYGRLAGGLYAVRGSWLQVLRTSSTRIPDGWIGEDLLLTCLAKGRLDPGGLFHPEAGVVIAQQAGFGFDSLSIARPSDWLVYLRRLIRYRLRDHQISLLMSQLAEEPARGIPRDVTALYREARSLPVLCWRGKITPFDILAVMRIRLQARR